MSPTWLHWPSTWSPDDLTSLRAWYDADDSATIFDATTGGSLPSSGNDVARWEDKSGGGYHVTQATAASRPHYVTNTLNGKPVMEFDGQDDWIEASTASHWAFLNQSGGAEIVAVWKAGTSADPETLNTLLSTNRGSVSNHGCYLAHDSRSSVSRDDVLVGAIRNAATGGSGTDYYLAATNDNFHDANTPTIVGLSLDLGNATADDKIRFRVNGGTSQGGNTSTRNVSTSNPIDPLRLGYFNGSVGWLGGYIAEVVICNAKLADSDREKLEGYLAHKWGLESNLPNTHPYKNSAP